MTLIQKIAQTLNAWNNCQNSGNSEWTVKHEQTLNRLENNYLPSGSGFDAGTKIDLDKSTGDKIIFITSYHHMNDAGYYNGWTEHNVTVKPEFNGISIKVSGSNRDGIKEYIAEFFHSILQSEFPE